MYRKPVSLTVTIPNGGDTSEVIDTRDHVIAGVILPADLTSTAMTLLGAGSPTGTFVPIYDSDGNAVSLVVAASHAVGLSGAEADAVAAFEFLKLKMGSAEGGDRSIIVALK